MMAADTIPNYRLFPSVRIFMIFLAFCGMTSLYCGFASFNFAIVCMVNSTWASQYSETNASTDECGAKVPGTGEEITQAYQGEFLWDKASQANLLAAHAWGAVWTSIPAGWLSDKYGSKYVFLACIVTNLVATALTPLAAHGGQAWVFAVRVFNGMAAGAGFPCVISMVTRWGGLTERGTFVALGTLGNQFGQLLAVATSGILCQSDLGWPTIFYIWSGLGVVVAVIWTLLYVDEPGRSRFVSHAEKQFIEKFANSSERSSQKVPWRYVLISSATFAIYACHFCNIWNFTFINQFLPTYSKEVLHLDIADNGVFSALPLLSQFVSCLFCGVLADRLVCKSKSMTFSLKVFSTLCMGVPCVGLLALTFLDCKDNRALPIFCFCLCTFFYSFAVASFMRSMVLIAPKLSGTVSAISNVWSYVASIAMPYTVGAVTKDGTADQWHTVFYIGLAISLFGCIEFLVFGSGEEQKWSKNVVAVEDSGDLKDDITIVAWQERKPENELSKNMKF